MDTENPTDILAFVDEALFGSWRMLAYEIPGVPRPSKKSFGLAVECSPEFFSRLGVAERFKAIGTKIRYVSKSTEPVGWCLYYLRMRNIRQYSKVETWVLRNYRPHLEATYAVWMEYSKHHATAALRQPGFAEKYPLEPIKPIRWEVKVGWWPE